jgi:3D (Asp-Asp-Asp) domain-containing protein
MNQSVNTGINRTLSSLSIATLVTFGCIASLTTGNVLAQDRKAQDKKANVETSNNETTNDAMELPGIFKMMPQASSSITEKSSKTTSGKRVSIPQFTADAGKGLVGVNARRIEKRPAQALARSLEKRDAKTILIPPRNNSWDSIKVEDMQILDAADFHATAYCLKGRTASGENVRQGFVAADPRVLPLGTLVHIQAGRYTGVYKVADTGGAIKGRKIDIYVPSYQEAKSFGRQRIKVKVLGRRK